MRLAAALVCSVALLLAWQNWKQNAAELFRQRKYAEAAAVLESGLSTDSRDFASYMLLGLSRQLQGDLSKAEAAYITAVQLEPRNARAHYSLARVRFLLGRFESALSEAEIALKAGEEEARVYHLRARIEEERGNLEPALRDYRRALKADRKASEALAGESSVLFKLGRYTEARASAQAALKVDPDNAEAKRVLEQSAKAVPTASTDDAVPIVFARKELNGFRLDHSPMPEKYLPSTMAGGLAVFDFDGDGKMDLFFANGAELPSLRKTDPRFWNRLFRNLGDWKFEDVTAAQKLEGEGFSMGAAAADFDNDGRIDLFVPGVKRNLLYRNTSSGFVEISRTAGIRDEPWSVGAAWLDYDRDGYLDLFVVNYVEWNPATEQYCGDPAKGVRVYCHPRQYRGLPNRLYRNRGDGTFEDVSVSSGIAKHIGKGMSAAVLDANGDGWPDIFVTNDTEPNYLFRNQGNGTFEESALRFGVAFNAAGQPVSSMGVDARDYDNDGLPDLIVTALTGENFLLARNSGKSGFQDVTYPSRIGVNAARRSGWGAVFADLNNDGWKDVITANSHVTDNVEMLRSERYREPNTVFLNRKGVFGAVQEIGPAAAHRGLAVADLDNDGRLDLVVTVLGYAPELWRNETPGAGNWLKVRLVGHSVGARVRVDSQWQERTSAAGYASSNLDTIHFGLGADKVVETVEVIWPDGKKQVERNVNAGQTLTLQEPARQ